MNKCPYTAVKDLFGFKDHQTKPAELTKASALRVQVKKNLETTVDVSLPANSARWLLELIPQDVLERIYFEKIPIDTIQADLANRSVLTTGSIFELKEAHRMISVWLE